MAKRISVVLSQGQSNHPAKRHLEEDLVTALMLEPGIDVTVVPNLYDLKPDGTGILALQGITGHMVVLSWLYSRAAFWTLDRHGILGQEGQTLLKSGDEEEEDDEEDGEREQAEAKADDKPRVRDSREVPRRKIYCLDLRSHDAVQVYVDEIKRIAAENATQVVNLMDWIGGQAQGPQLGRYLQPTNDTALGGGSENGNGAASGNGSAGGNGSASGNGSTTGRGAAAGKAPPAGHGQEPSAEAPAAGVP
ncbi:MAG: hypothetical protein J5I93_27060, partial [Pirellulaceae bacterium]|nr:hypothetical protein [Pirellulaceae bacterium]